MEAFKTQSLKTKHSPFKSKIFFADEFALDFEQHNRSDNLFVFDTNTEKLFSNYIGKENKVVIPAGESAKNIFTVQKILETAVKKKLTRSSVIFAVGGGVVCDITAFCASVFKRGANLVLVPTSLLAMVDASVGGKTGFDFAGVKNSVGSFYTAKDVLIFFDCLKSLSCKEYKNGLAEILKIGMINEKRILTFLAKTSVESFFTPSKVLKELIFLSVLGKIKIVKKDPQEKNQRKFLNLGHTFAHALEALTNFELISHGEAVAWGIEQELRLGISLGVTSAGYAQKISAILKRFDYKTETFDKELANYTKLSYEDFCKNLVSLMQNDKKNTDSKITFALQKNQGRNFLLRLEPNFVYGFLINKGIRLA